MHSRFPILIFLLALTGPHLLQAQAIPKEEENIPFIVTFGADAPADWGDDDHCSTFFISLPYDYQEAIYLRVFDPDIGGAHDENRSGFDTQTQISIYGGKGTFSEPDARSIDPIGNYKSGNELFSKTFGKDPRYDDQWYTFGPINPKEGERFTLMGVEKIYFKVIVEGISGDDGNLYRYFVSTQPDQNVDVEGCEPFTFEYSFRMGKGISHLYPFIDDQVIRIRQHNFDFDGDGYLRFCSLARKSEMVQHSQGGDWSVSTHKIFAKERGACMDLQIVSLVERRNNNMVFYITNQYGEALPFMNYPFGLEDLINKVKVVKD